MNQAKDAATPSDDTAGAGTDKVPAYSWYALGVLVLIYVLNFIDRQILSILANDIKADLGVEDDYLGFLYGTAFAVFYALFGIPLGKLADSWKRVRLMSLGLALWSTMTALSGFAKNATTLTVARIGVGVGEATARKIIKTRQCTYSNPERIRADAWQFWKIGDLQHVNLGDRQDGLQLFVGLVDGGGRSLICWIRRGRRGHD